MGKLLEFMGNFMQEWYVLVELRNETLAQRRPYVYAITICAFAIPILFFIIVSISIKIESRREKKLLAKGTYHKELPIEEIEISLAEGERCFQITCKTETVLTPNAKEAEGAKKENKQKKLELFKGIVSDIVPKEEVCLLARTTNISALTEAGRDDLFRLDVCPVWEKKRNEEWLSQYETIQDLEGHTIAIRGVDGQVIARGYDILIPKEDTARLCTMSGEELLKFCEAENCKLQIKEKGSIISFSETDGFTKEEVTEKIRRIAEEQGYKVELK